LDEGLRVRGNEDYLYRLVNNALTNIVRHTNANDEVLVSLRRRAHEAELVIEDAGPGLPVYGERPQRFRRFDDSRSRETGGSGLGMSIMADVVESMGGSLVTRRSSLGGLAVVMRVPLAGASNQPLAART
ncbi:MAG: ATP-binding protein, partial [Acidobacteriota bacterium]|nr:ATP-binding protein [Acidobacteriota bacterium]